LGAAGLQYLVEELERDKAASADELEREKQSHLEQLANLDETINEVSVGLGWVWFGLVWFGLVGLHCMANAVLRRNYSMYYIPC
jgi:hypothetical protein